jgi:hypothetical protein
MGKKSGSVSGIRIWDEQPGSHCTGISESLKNNFWVKTLICGSGIRDGKKSDTG